MTESELPQISYDKDIRYAVNEVSVNPTACAAELAHQGLPQQTIAETTVYVSSDVPLVRYITHDRSGMAVAHYTFGDVAENEIILYPGLIEGATFERDQYAARFGRERDSSHSSDVVEVFSEYTDAKTMGAEALQKEESDYLRKEKRRVGRSRVIGGAVTGVASAAEMYLSHKFNLDKITGPMPYLVGTVGLLGGAYLIEAARGVANQRVKELKAVGALPAKIRAQRRAADYRQREKAGKAEPIITIR